MHDLTIVFHDAGGGHRSAAGALKTVLEQQYHPWNVKLLNLQELLDPIDFVHRATGLRIQDGYNLILKKGWTRLTPPLADSFSAHHPAASFAHRAHFAELLGCNIRLTWFFP